MERYKRNGVRLLTDSAGYRKRKGCNTAKCPPPENSTIYPRRRGKGVTLAKYLTIWPTVKHISSLGSLDVDFYLDSLH
jgi:hypothetical protein